MKSLNLIAIWGFIAYGMQLYAETVDGMHLYGEVSFPIVIKMKDVQKSLGKSCNEKNNHNGVQGLRYYWVG